MPLDYSESSDGTSAPPTTAQVSGLTPSTSYLFYVTATNDFGESAHSNTTSAITSPAVPAAPTGLTATLTDGDICLNWTAGDTLATGFNIYESAGNGSTCTLCDSVDGSTTSDIVYSPTAGTTPQFYLTATNSSGESAASSIVSQVAPIAFGSVRRRSIPPPAR